MSSKKSPYDIKKYPFDSFGNELKKLRGNLNKKIFAKEIGVHYQTYLRYEKGERRVPDGILKLARMLYNKDKPSIPQAADPAASYQVGAPAFMKAADMLDAILNSGDPVFTQALMSNLIAFSEVINTRNDQNQRIKNLEGECEDLKARLAALEEKYKLIAPQPQPEEIAA